MNMFDLRGPSEVEPCPNYQIRRETEVWLTLPVAMREGIMAMVKAVATP